VDNPSLVDVVVSSSHQTHGPHVVLADAEHQLRIGTAPDKPVVIVAEQLQRRRRRVSPPSSSVVRRRPIAPRLLLQTESHVTLTECLHYDI